MAIECPLCDKVTKDARGMYGHLSYGHKLSGDELDERFQQAKDEGYVEVEEPEPEPELRESLEEVDLSNGTQDSVSGSTELAALLDRYTALESRLRVLSKCQDPTASLMEWTSQYDKLLGDLKEKKEQLFDQIQTKLGEELNDG